MSNVFVSSEDVLQTSASISALDGEVQNCFAAMKNEMQSMSAVWQSPAGDTCQERFAQLHPTFEAACQTLEALASFLHQTALSYQENEGALSMGGV